MRPSDWELLGIEGMQEAINSDNVAKVRRLCHRHAALAASQSIPLEFGGIFRLVMTDACRAGSDKVITWVVAACEAETYWTTWNRHEQAPIIRCPILLPHKSHRTKEFKTISVLHSAALEGHVRTVRVLLDLGADTEQTNYKGETTLATMLRKCDTQYMASIAEPSEPRLHCRVLSDYHLACLCLLLHRGAHISPEMLASIGERTSTPPGRRRNRGRISPPAGAGFRSPTASARALARYLEAPPRDYPGISRCSSLQAMRTRHELLLAWHLAQRQPRTASAGFRMLPFEILKTIAEQIGPFLQEPSQQTIREGLMHNWHRRVQKGDSWHTPYESLGNPWIFDRGPPPENRWLWTRRLIGKGRAATAAAVAIAVRVAAAMPCPEVAIELLELLELLLQPS